MRNFITVLLAIFILSISVSAEEEKVSTSINLKNDWSDASGKTVDSQKMFVLWHYKNIGGGMDMAITRRKDYFQVDPFLTFNRGPWYLVGGASVDNFSQYIQGGFWYMNSIGKTFVFADIRNYFATGGNAKDYIEGFFELKQPIGKRFFMGADLDYVLWREGNNSYFLFGPIVGVKINKNISVYMRISREWNIIDDKSDGSNRFRLGMTISF